MSYIAFELDALNVVADVAAASGLSPGDVAHGLLRLWAHCFRAETDAVTSVHLAGFFGGRDASPALMAFGFLGAAEGGFRVRGAARYLRVAEGRRRGGRLAKANLIPGGPKRGASPRLEPRASREEAEGTAPAPKTRRVKKEADARHGPLLLALEAASPGYVVQARDAKAVKALLALGEPEEVLARWRRALAAEGYPRVRATWELAAHWHHFGPEEATRRGPVPAESVDWSGQTETRVLEFGGGQ